MAESLGTEDTFGFDLSINPWGHAPHAHTFGQLIYAASGRATIRIHALGSTATSQHTIDPHSAVWIPPMTWHSARFDPGFSASTHTVDLDPAQTKVRMLIVDARVRAELLATQWTPDEGLGATRTALAAQSPESGAAPPRPRTGLVHAIAEALDVQPADDRDLSAWARELHTSPATIRRAFKSATGLTYSDWRTRHRVHAALLLLRAGKQPSRVAVAVGYSNAGLSAAIRRRFHCAPSDLMPPTPTHHD